MAYGIVHHFKGGTKEQYDATLKAVHPDDGKSLPAGQTHHAAGPTKDGWLVTAIWETKEHFEDFAKNVLHKVLGEPGTKGFAGPPEETTFEVHNEQKK